MVFNKKTHEFQTRNDAPNSNFMNDNSFIVINDNSEIANKIIKFSPYFKIIENENGEIIDVIEDKVKKEKQEFINLNLLQIEELKQKLFNTDYQAIKFAEGLISEEEYTPIKEQRQAWRDKINELEAQLEV